MASIPNNLTWHTCEVSNKERSDLKMQLPFVLWFTGLSASGKSSIANQLDRQLFNLGYHTYILDGDNIRHGLNKDLTFSSEDRIENIRRIGEVAALFNNAGLIVLCAFISPFAADRKLVRDQIQEGRFVEIFIDTPLSVCEDRDPKGIYKLARSGGIKGFTGIDSDYEPPLKPEIHINNEQLSIDESVRLIKEYLVLNKYISPD